MYVSYAANRKARVLVKMDNEIVMDSLIQEQLGEIKVGSVKMQMMSDSSLSEFHPPPAVLPLPVHAIFLSV